MPFNRRRVASSSGVIGLALSTHLLDGVVAFLGDQTTVEGLVPGLSDDTLVKRIRRRRQSIFLSTSDAP